VDFVYKYVAFISGMLLFAILIAVIIIAISRRRKQIPQLLIKNDSTKTYGSIQSRVDA